MSTSSTADTEHITVLEAEIDDLNTRMANLTDECDDLKRENEALTEKVETASSLADDLVRGLGR